MKVNFRIIFVLSFLFLISCWNKQEHDITRPAVPFYQLSGNAVQMGDTTQVARDIRVEISAAQMTYDVNFQTQDIMADSSGFFHFDTVYPGMYTLNWYQNEYRIADKTIFMSHEDRWLQLTVPKILQSEDDIIRNNTPGPVGGPLLISWKGQKAWVTGSYRVQLKSYPAIYRTEAVTNGQVITLTPELYFDTPIPEYYYMDVKGQLLYMAFATDVGILDLSDGQVLDAMDLDSQSRLSGITHNSRGFWTTYQRFLQFRGEDIRTVNESYDTEASVLTAVTAVGNTFYAYDNVRELLVHLKSDGTILSSYRLYGDDPYYWLHPIDVEYSSYYNRLWIPASAAFSRTFYTFKLPGDGQ